MHELGVLEEEREESSSSSAAAAAGATAAARGGSASPSWSGSRTGAVDLAALADVAAVVGAALAGTMSDGGAFDALLARHSASVARRRRAEPPAEAEPRKRRPEPPCPQPRVLVLGRAAVEDAERGGAPRVLVVVPAGPSSLHEELHPWRGSERGGAVDLCLIWYGADPAPEPTRGAATYYAERRGPKWQLVRYALTELVPDFDARYEYVWLPDDDVRFEDTGGSWSGTERLARAMRLHGLELAQPCLLDKNLTSRAAADVLLRQPGALAHRTNFVEIMAPMFSASAARRVLLLSIDRDACRSGWGLDSVWPALLGPRAVGVVDTVRLEHTRAPQAFRAPAGGYQAGAAALDPRSEEFETMREFRVALTPKRVLELVVGADAPAAAAAAAAPASDPGASERAPPRRGGGV